MESESFRAAIALDATVADLAKAQMVHWRSWRENLEQNSNSVPAGEHLPAEHSASNGNGRAQEGGQGRDGEA